MRHTFHVFPAGLAGAGLLLLRVSVAYRLFASAYDHPLIQPWQVPCIALLAITLALGLWTRKVAGATIGVTSLVIVTGSEGFSSFLIASLADAIALTLIGPGAFSIDARVFGRRTIHLSQ